jgi:hypothetical protein
MDQMVMEPLAQLFNEAEGLDASSFVKETKVKSHTRKRQSGSVESVVPEALQQRWWSTVFLMRSAFALSAALRWWRSARKSAGA